MMTKNNSFKKAVRSRMFEYHEPFSVAKRVIETNRLNPTPWDKLNDLIEDFKPGSLYVIAGRPGSGKRLFASKLIEHNVHNNRKTALFEQELSLSEIQNVNYINSKKYVFELTNINNEDSIQNIQDFVDTVEPELLVINYLQLLVHRKEDTSYSEQIEKFLIDLKRIAHASKLPIVLLSQLNRNSLNTFDIIPSINRLGVTAQIADVVIIVNVVIEGQSYRFDVLKNRFGACKTINVGLKMSEIV
jgi:replicative DNA helicase